MKEPTFNMFFAAMDFMLLIIFLFLILLCLMAYLFFRMQHFKSLSITDDLTGLMNYRGLRTNIKNIIHSNPVFTLALIDLDNFKSFNKHGYSLGDEALQEFISFLKKTVADHMIIVRFRIGDEFIIILKNTDQLAAEQQISDVKTKCWNYPFKCLETFSEKHLSFSSGIVQYSAEYNTLEKLIREADIRLKKV